MSGRKLEDYLQYDENSPSGLIWLKSPNNHKNKLAGTFTDGYWKVKFDHRHYVSSHVVLLLHGMQVDKGLVVDHMDGNTSNNSISNLRITTVAINARNKTFNKEGKVGVNLITIINGTKNKINKYWEVSWYEDNKLQRKKLNCERYTEQDAIELRNTKITELNEKGYSYSIRHMRE